MNKKAQVTTFVIIGIVLLIIIGLLVVLTTMDKEDDPEEQFTYNLPADIEPIKDNIKFCLKETAKETLIEIGMRGGFTKEQTQNTFTDFPLSYQNTGLELFKDSEPKIPYWLYLEDKDNGGNVRLNMPLLENSRGSIQEAVEERINKEMITCTDNLNVHRAQFQLEVGEPKSKVLFNAKDVTINLDWPITIVRDDEDIKFNKFQEKIDVNFKETYELARDILFQLQLLNESFIEDSTLNMLYIYSTGKSGVIPPINGPSSDSDISDFKIWYKDEVENELKGMISENIPYFQVEGTKDSQILFSNSKDEFNIYSNFQAPFYPISEHYKDVRVKFNYQPNWPMYVTTDPGFGDVMMPELQINQFLFFTFQQANYNFKYDITYPVLITLEDDNAFNGEGFTFQYAYETNIRRNNAVTKNLNLSAMQKPKDVLDIENQRTIPIKVTTVDGYTNQPIADVLVLFRCVSEDIALGKSRMESGSASLKSKLMPCALGNLYVLDNEYTASPKYLTATAGNNLDVKLEVFKEKTVPVEFKKKLYGPTRLVSEIDEEHMDRGWEKTPGNAYVTVIEDEELNLILLGVNELGEPLSSTIISYNDTVTNPNISLVPGTYEVYFTSILSLNNYPNQQIVIPEFTIDMPWFANLMGADDAKIPEVPLNDSLILSNMQYLFSEGKTLTITKSDLVNAKKIEFIYPSYDPTELKVAMDLEVLNLVTSNVDEEFGLKIVK